MIDHRERFPKMLSTAYDVSPPPGWDALVEALLKRIHDSLDSEAREAFRVSQIKEKYGELRVYHNGDDEVEAMVDEATETSRRTCQICGEPGKITNNKGWVAALCEEHAKKPYMVPTCELR
ncbi:MAG: hypothetical protein ABJF67_03340 [Aurantimonas coralicida]|uniref:hypothetical protein n=1 Tax=Nisaea sp. TaxID=2024842 RepID=UPI003264ED07